MRKANYDGAVSTEQKPARQRISPAVLTGIFLAVLLTVFLLAMYFVLSKPSATDVFLGDNSDGQNGWSYQILQNGEVTSATPVLPEGGFERVFQESGITAVKATRTMIETMELPELSFGRMGVGIEVFFNGNLLYSDFAKSTASYQNGFLSLTEEDLSKIQDINGTVTLSLPDDYTGGTLTVVNYLPGGYTPNETWLSYPDMINLNTQIAPALTGAVIPIAKATVAALLAVLLTVLFAFGANFQKPQYSIFLLVLYCLLTFLQIVTQTAPGDYSAVPKLTLLNILGSVYIDALLAFLALQMCGYRRILLLAVTGIHLVTEAVRISLNAKNGLFIAANDHGILPFVLFVLLCLLSVIEMKKGSSFFRRFTKGLIPLGAFLLFMLGCKLWYRGTVDPFFTFRDDISAIRMGNFRPVNQILYGYIPLLSAVVLALSVIQGRIKHSRVLEGRAMRTEMAEQSYQQMRQAIEQTAAARHEMKHKTELLYSMLSAGKTDEATDELRRLSDNAAALPKAQYSGNLLVNTIAAPRLERARAMGISVQHSLQLPETLAIGEADLCTLLTNLLDNAVDAASAAGGERFIRFQMWQENGTLLITCENSYEGSLRKKENGEYATTKPNPFGHGYGISAMRAVAEKYGSVLKIDADGGIFSVKTVLLLPESHSCAVN